MKIIKEGDLRRLSTAREFTCERCGCVFVASAGEYITVPDYRNGTMLEIACPTCTGWVYMEA